VPFRNSLFLAAATAWAETLGATAIFIGANFLDNPGYPDCRPAYYDAYNRVIALGTRPGLTSRSKHPSSNSTRRASCVWASSSRRPLSLPGHAT